MGCLRMAPSDVWVGLGREGKEGGESEGGAREAKCVCVYGEEGERWKKGEGE